MQSYTSYDKDPLLAIVMRACFINSQCQTKSLLFCKRLGKRTALPVVSRIKHLHHSDKAHRPSWAHVEELAKELNSIGLNKSNGPGRGLLKALKWLHSDRQTSARSYRRLNRLVLDTLEWVLEVSGINGPGCVSKLRSDEVTKLFDNSDQGRLNTDFELLALEAQPGQRLLYTGLPTYLLLESGPSLRGTKHTISECLRQLHLERTKNFKTNIRRFGERAIHSERAIEDYLKPSDASPLEHEARVGHVRSLHMLLEEEQRRRDGGCTEGGGYQVRLERDAPGMEFIVKAAGRVCLTGIWHDHSRKDGLKDDTLGGWQAIRAPYYVFWYGGCPALRFLIDFERRWKKLEEQSDTYVIERLKSLVKAADENRLVNSEISEASSNNNGDVPKREAFLASLSSDQAQELEGYARDQLVLMSNKYWKREDVPRSVLRAFMCLFADRQ